MIRSVILLAFISLSGWAIAADEPACCQKPASRAAFLTGKLPIPASIISKTSQGENETCASACSSPTWLSNAWWIPAKSVAKLAGASK